MNFRKNALGLAIAGLALVVSAPAQAQFTSFATFTSLGGDAFKFTNNNPGGSLGTSTGSPIAVSFQYIIPNDTGFVNTTIAATMSVTATASSTLIAGVIQPMNNITLTFTADTAINGKTNLLTLATSSGALTRTGTTTATLAGTEGGGGGDTVTFSSDFLNFASTSVRDFSISNTGITPNVSANGNGYFNTWTATATTGSFSSDPAPVAFLPEPGTLALMALGSVGLVGIARRRRH